MLNQTQFFQAHREQGYQTLYSPTESSLHYPARTPSRPPSTGWERLASIWQQVSRRVAQRSQLSIEEKINSKGETWWQVKDPRSGKSFYAQTLNEAVHWIEVQRLGK